MAIKSASERRAAMIRLVESKTVVRVAPPLLLPASPYLDLAGEEFGRQLLLTTANNGIDYCLRPDFTLPIAKSYLDEGMLGVPGAYTYFGPIFRQESGVPIEYDQAGLELLGQPDASSALDQVLTFARWALAIYDVTAPNVRLGGVGLFESFLAAIGISAQWQARIRHRFGHPAAMDRLMSRLTSPDNRAAGATPDAHETIVEIVTDNMISAGLSLVGSRAPDEIAERYIEKQALDAVPIPEEMVQLLVDYLAVTDTVGRALDRIRQLTGKAGIDLEAPLSKVRSHAAALAALSPKAEVLFDASFSPRLDYYTGVVFEMTGADGDILASGGEYDRLMDRLGAPEQVTASGCALWTDRLEAEATRERG
ncbi:MAG TPA: ATP phosphoribosyltransferase regulatory subunit [Devosia sp.]|nr:ATP phosphoribosyltransferase regulatory subunit [Devosia sp.]